MTITGKYDAAITGGGLAGLALSIQLARMGHSVILFEKENYPFHKVCGEYISLESWDFLVDLGIDLVKLEVPVINRLQLTSTNGNSLVHDLPLGGFGISRYLLDHLLAQVARQEGVIIMENCKVNDIRFENEAFITETTAGNISSRVACGSFGKRSNLDIKWKRKFSLRAANKLNNYIGVKYHVKTTHPHDMIALHYFDHGYCGIVKIEDDLFNLCYLTTASNLEKSGNDIQAMESAILSQNPFLDRLFSSVQFINRQPSVISQVSFEKKSLIENHILIAGDSAGMITPLCGNGMSMALHASKLAASQIHSFLAGQVSREKMEKRYTFHWNRQFSRRLKNGRLIQKILNNNFLSSFLIRTGKKFPGLLDQVIRKTHGKPF